ncbi:hypothetical protein WM11_06670 [Burkholderia ubonensis]|nr:hypothetical protein WM10_19265 [Burkholderia ubonensis]KWK09255.1 hypothetical protein WM11_06670 [Burkholderia ubonensis]KWK10567.1 hypothetical protein WM12_00755 [Burkholderia ubonensis]KWK38110.1 hypothetical protein WM13_22135 [Burkholderia ubonensis]KWK40670.1 hypothetical protein WM14_18005 [Burkholderia ubonensis]
MTEFVVADTKLWTCQLRQKGVEVIPAGAVVDWHMAVDVPLSFSLGGDHLEIFLRRLRRHNGFPISERQFDGCLMIHGPQIRRFNLLVRDCVVARLYAICPLGQ